MLQSYEDAVCFCQMNLPSCSPKDSGQYGTLSSSNSPWRMVPLVLRFSIPERCLNAVACPTYKACRHFTRHLAGQLTGLLIGSLTGANCWAQISGHATS